MQAGAASRRGLIQSCGCTRARVEDTTEMGTFSYADPLADFPTLCENLLHHSSSARLVFMAFDVLSVQGRSVRSEPFSERRQSFGR